MSDTATEKSTVPIVFRGGKVLVRLSWSADTASGHRRGWGKIVTGVNRGLRGGYAVDGDFLRDGAQELPDGAVLLDMTPAGSAKRQENLYSLAWVDPTTEDGYRWVLRHQKEVSPAFLDMVEEQIALSGARQAMAQYAATAVLTPAVALKRIDLSGFTVDDLRQLQADVAERLGGAG